MSATIYRLPRSLPADLAPAEFFEATKKDREFRLALEELDRAIAACKTATEAVTACLKEREG